MARVSLLLPIASGDALPVERMGSFRDVLEGLGHTVEVIVAGDSSALPSGSWRAVAADRPDLAVATVAGLRAARGDVLIVLDPRRGYTPEALGRVVAPLLAESADLVIGSRWFVDGPGPGLRGLSWPGRLLRPLSGSSDPLSGLVALTRAAARATDEAFAPIGSRFALELLARVPGRRCDVSARGGGRGQGNLIVLNDLRHLKRLADDRFGNLSRLVQFCVVGASGMVVDLTCYALFQLAFETTGLARGTAPVIGGSLALAVAGALAIALALVWNFTLNRHLTFSYARHGSVARQFVKYALSNALGIALSFTVRLLLPVHMGFFQRHRLAAAVVGIVAATGISFSMSRWVVFSRRSVARDHARRTAPPAMAKSSTLV